MSSSRREADSSDRAPSGAPRLRSLPGDRSGGQRAPGRAERQLQDLWDRHGTSVYALAWALLGHEGAAMKAVTLGMADLALSPGAASGQDARRVLSRHVYRRSQELLGDTSVAQHLPPAMVWIAQLAPLQRACLALCCFGGLTHREAADLLEVSPVTAAELLTAGLREMAAFPAVRTAILR